MIVLIAAVIDVKKRIIPNYLTYSALLAGLFVSLVTDLSPGLLQSLAGGSIAFVVTYLLFAFNSIGGGDVKLLTAVGVWAGYPIIIDILLYSFVSGFILALWVVFRNCNFNRWLSLIFMSSTDNNQACKTTKTENAEIPFAVGIALGTIGAFMYPLTANLLFN